MKKLMIAAAIVCAAVASQASTVVWNSKASTGSSGSLYAPDGTTELSAWAGQSGYSITDVILMNTADYTQSELLEGLRDGSYTFGANALDTSTVTSKGVTQATTDELTTLAGQTVSLYYAVFATDKSGNESVLISSLKEGIAIPASAGASTDAKWGKDGHTFSAVNNGTATYSAAGWYAIPEPTSGLLLLLGMAGLALKRKRA